MRPLLRVRCALVDGLEFNFDFQSLIYIIFPRFNFFKILKSYKTFPNHKNATLWTGVLDALGLRDSRAWSREIPLLFEGLWMGWGALERPSPSTALQIAKEILDPRP